MTKYEFIFTKKFPQRLYRHIVFWLLYYIFSTLVYFHDGLGNIGFKKWIELEASEAFFHVITQMLFCYAVLYLLLPKFLMQKKYFAFITGITVLSILIYFLYYFEHVIFFKALHVRAGMKFRPPEVVRWFTLISFFTYFPISSGLVIAIRMLKNFYIKQKENQLLTRENANAELQLLKVQVHPHFLFNTLNNIYSFSLIKSPDASMLISKLTDTIHYMITDCKAEMVPLQKELKMLEDYIGLEKVRYGNRLELFTNIKKEGADILIAPLLLIPFVENCFKHGSSMMTGRPWIRISTNITGNTLDFKITNSKPAEAIKTKNKKGIGLENVKKRLQLIYPGRHQLHINSNANEYNVHMTIQLN